MIVPLPMPSDIASEIIAAQHLSFDLIYGMYSHMSRHVSPRMVASNALSSALPWIAGRRRFEELIRSRLSALSPSEHIPWCS